MIENNCVFCKILKGEIPSVKVFEDDKMLVFKDIEPKAMKRGGVLLVICFLKFRR